MTVTVTTWPPQSPYPLRPVTRSSVTVAPAPKTAAARVAAGTSVVQSCRGSQLPSLQASYRAGEWPVPPALTDPPLEEENSARTTAPPTVRTDPAVAATAAVARLSSAANPG